MDSQDISVDPSSILQIDRIIHAPARLLILAILKQVLSADWVFLMENTKLTKGNLSSHLHKLEDAQYIKVKKKFINKVPKTLISITETGKSALRKYRAKMNTFLNHL